MGGEKTDGAVLEWAEKFYTAIGKHALTLRKEISGYISNRLQQVVSKEIHRLVESGICDYQEADRALVYGPGLRWAFAGPLMCTHLGGGQGGIESSIAHWGWGGPAQLEDEAVDTAKQMAGGQTMTSLESWRDDNILTMLEQLKFTPPR